MRNTTATKLIQKTLDEETSAIMGLTKISQALHLEWLGEGEEDEMAEATVNSGSESVSLKKPRAK
jgi:hypothetical protein